MKKRQRKDKYFCMCNFNFSTIRFKLKYLIKLSIIMTGGHCWPVNSKTTTKIRRNTSLRYHKLILKYAPVHCCCSVTQLCLILRNPMVCSTPGFPVFTISRRLLKFMSIELVMPSNISSSVVPFSSCPQFPRIRVFSSESALCNQVCKVSELQFQHKSFPWIFRVDFL